MPNRRGTITLGEDQQQAFLEQGKTIYLASNGADGHPHLIAMWYGRDKDVILMTTYRKSQKVKNLIKDPRCSVLLEEGASYEKLKGLFLRGTCEVIDDEETTLQTLGRIGARMAGSTAPVPAAALEGMRRQAKKRVTLRFRTQKVASWDHGKLGGVY